MFPAYIVEYMRLGKEESFITKDISRAEECATQYHGTLTPLVKWLNNSNNTEPSSMIAPAGFCLLE